MLVEEIKSLFERVFDSYIFAKEDGLEGFSEDDEYQYQMSRVYTTVEEWRSEMNELLNDKKK